jgi:hypothetical protein
MDKRTFLKQFGAATFGLAGFAPSLSLRSLASRPDPSQPGALRRQSGTKNWAWVHGGRERSADEWKRAFAIANDAGIDALLVSGGSIETLAPIAHSEGLEFHRWIWTLNRSGDREVKEVHPEWFSVSRNGESSLEKPPYVGYYQWLCPSRPEVREYLRGVVERLARQPGLDGVHLDYIRHPDVILPIGLWSKYDLVQDREYPEFDFCYCEVCREQFRSQSGTDPLELPDPSLNVAWREFRHHSVTVLVNELAEVVHRSGRRITAAVFPTPQLARKLVRQEWEKWQLDAVLPMVYHEFYEEPVAWIGSAVAEGVDALAGLRPLYSGLYIPDLSPEELPRAVEVSLGNGAAGVSLFNLGAMSEAHWAALKRALGRA